jgi:hypothetical protein
MLFIGGSAVNCAKSLLHARIRNLSLMKFYIYISVCSVVQEGRTTSPSLAGPVRTSQKYAELPDPFLPNPRQILIPLPTKTEVNFQSLCSPKTASLFSRFCVAYPVKKNLRLSPFLLQYETYAATSCSKLKNGDGVSSLICYQR